MFEYECDKHNTLVPSQTNGPHIPVNCTTLDAYCSKNDITRVGLLKIDTEGFDLEVLRGGENLLARRAVGFVYAEFADLQGEDGATLLPIDNFLRPLGYRFVTTYIEWLNVDAKLSTTANALFMLMP